MRLAFESVDSGKQIALPNVSGHHPIHGGPEYTKAEEEGYTYLPLVLFFWNALTNTVTYL